MFYEVVTEASETANKCTIAPLFYRPDFNLIRVKGQGEFGPLRAAILLHHEGQCLTAFQKKAVSIDGIATIDCVWRRLDLLIGKVAGPLPTLVRIPEGFETAYPRRSYQDDDPQGGLATIEAIFVAAALLGHWDQTLLSEYYFGGKFIELNKERFLAYGVHQASDENLRPKYDRERNSSQRRRDRGRI